MKVVFFVVLVVAAVMAGLMGYLFMGYLDKEFKR